MTAIQLSDLDLAALMSSKICHDFISPVNVIGNSLEVHDEDDDPQTRSYALDVIRNVNKQATAKLQFMRYAFGAAGSAGSTLDTATAEEISRGLVGTGKHKLIWQGLSGAMAKDHVKLLLNLFSCALTALNRGGDIVVTIAGTLERPEFSLRCRGPGARPPQYLTEFLANPAPPPVDAMTIQAYYTIRLAASSHMRLEIFKDGADILLSAKSSI